LDPVAVRMALSFSPSSTLEMKKGANLNKQFAQLMEVVMATIPVWWCIAMGLAFGPLMLGY